MKDEAPAAAGFPGTTDLERRVLAHEKILQAMIAFMARTEPRFIDHLRARFVDPMSVPGHEHDHRETDNYAEDFMRAVMLQGDLRAPIAKKPEMTDVKPLSIKRLEDRETSTNRPLQRGGVQVRERNGIWAVQVDGKFHGDYHQKEHALAAAALHELSHR